MTDRQQLEATVRRLDGELHRLNGPRVDLSGPGLLDRMRAAAEVYRRLEPEREAAHQEADRLLPELLDLYRGGGDDDREWGARPAACLPNLSLGGRSGRRPAAAADRPGSGDPGARAVLDEGWRRRLPRPEAMDRRLCASLGKSGLDVAALLRQAAAWSSDAPRFPPAWSTRTLRPAL